MKSLSKAEARLRAKQYMAELAMVEHLEWLASRKRFREANKLKAMLPPHQREALTDAIIQRQIQRLEQRRNV